MALKCNHIGRLQTVIENNFNVRPDTSQIGKVIFRIEGLTCTLFSNGTVMFQGKDESGKVKFITDATNQINRNG